MTERPRSVIEKDAFVRGKNYIPQKPFRNKDLPTAAKPDEIEIGVGDMDPGEFVEIAHAIETEVGEVIVGQKDVIRNTLIAIIARNHVLLEGVPGLGKTLLVKSFAEAIDLEFSRVQFTPDLMPADITGTDILLEDIGGARHMVFKKGPLFTSLLLADELNRATPKTQSALLESMQERTVTAAGHKYPLPEPFFVLATQNPIEQEGVYPLAEAAQDRFFFKLLVTFPNRDESYEIQRRTTTKHEPTINKVADGPKILQMEKLIRKVPILPELEYYAIDIVLATHQEQNEVEVPEVVKRYVDNSERGGASPRGYQTIILAAKAHALLEGRFNVSAEDIKSVALPSLRHRITLNFMGEEETTTDEVIKQILEEVPVP